MGYHYLEDFVALKKTSPFAPVIEQLTLHHEHNKKSKPFFLQLRETSDDEGSPIDMQLGGGHMAGTYIDQPELVDGLATLLVWHIFGLGHLENKQKPYWYSHGDTHYQATTSKSTKKPVTRGVKHFDVNPYGTSSKSYHGLLAYTGLVLGRKNAEAIADILDQESKTFYPSGDMVIKALRDPQYIAYFIRWVY